MNKLHSDSPCPAPETLRQLLLGKLAEAEIDSISLHVDGCDQCADLIARLDSEDGLLTILSGNSDVKRQGSPTLADANHPEIDGSDQKSEGKRIAHFRILNELGRGGMGVVYAAEDTRLRRRVALKLMHAGAAKSSQYQVRFEREVDALAKLNHPNIVRVYEAGRHKALPFLVMEFVPGGTLANDLKGQPQPARSAAELTATLADAVQFAHEQGVIHRDLKPSNILLTQTRSETADTQILPASGSAVRQPKIADFGLARHTDNEGLTQSGDLLGTPGYMAPEMTRGGDLGPKDSPAVDVYGLGAILYEMLTGRPPFRGETVPDTFEQVRNMDPVPVRQLQPKVPRDLETICLKCLQKSPAKRYASAADLADDLRRFLSGWPIRARPAGVLERSAKWVRRKPAWAAAVGVLFFASLTLIGVGVRYEQRLRQSRDDAEQSADEARQARTIAEQNADEAKRERENAIASYREARGALEKILERTSEKRHGDLPRIRELRREQQKDALAFYQRMAEKTTGESLEMRYDAAHARLQAGLLQLQLDNSEPDDNLQRAFELAEGLLREKPDDPRFQRVNAECLFQLSMQKHGEERVRLLERADAQIEIVIRQEPRSQPFRYDRVRILCALANCHRDEKRFDEAVRYYQEAVAIEQEMIDETPDRRDLKVYSAQTRANLVHLKQQAKRSFEELEPEVKALGALLEKFTSEDPNDAESLIALATLRLNWTYMLINQGRGDDALPGLGEAIDRLEQYLKREPNWNAARHTLHSAYGTRAIVHDRKGRSVEAAKDYRRVVQLAPTPEARKSLRSELVGLLILSHDYDACLHELETSAADTVPMYSDHILHRILKGCDALMKVSLWKAHPYRARAIEAARKDLEHTRSKIPPADWEKFMKSTHAHKDLKHLANLPELQAALK